MKRQKITILIAAVLVIVLLSALLTHCARSRKSPLEKLEIDQVIEIVQKDVAILYDWPEIGWLEADEIDFSNLSVGNPVYAYEYMGGEEDAFRRSANCYCIVYSGDRPLCNVIISFSTGEPIAYISADILPVPGKEAALVFSQDAAYAYCDGEFVELYHYAAVPHRVVLDPETATVKEGELILTDGLSPNGVRHPIPPVEIPE